MESEKLNTAKTLEPAWPEVLTDEQVEKILARDYRPADIYAAAERLHQVAVYSPMLERRALLQEMHARQLAIKDFEFLAKRIADLEEQVKRLEAMQEATNARISSAGGSFLNLGKERAN